MSYVLFVFSHRTLRSHCTFSYMRIFTGKYLKRQPLARAGFIFYLFLMHLWTFVLLFFHAHSFNTAQEADLLGNGVGSSHGPHAIMQQQLRLDATNLANEKSGKNLIGTDFTELVSNKKGK